MEHIRGHCEVYGGGEEGNRIRMRRGQGDGDMGTFRVSHWKWDRGNVPVSPSPCPRPAYFISCFT